jgi:hypothetical protein
LKPDNVENLVLVQSSFIWKETLLDNDPIRVIQSWTALDLIANKDAVMEKSSLIIKIPWNRGSLKQHLMRN